MNKSDLIKAVSKSQNLTQVNTEVIIHYIMGLIMSAINMDGRFEYPGFGVFKKVRRASCQKHNPGNPEQKILVPAHNTVKFRPSPVLKKLVNG